MSPNLSIKLWLLWYPFRFLARHAPFQFSYFVAALVAWCAYRLSRRKTDRIRDVLRRIMDIDNEACLARIIRRSFDLKVKNDVDILLYPRINKSNLNSVVSIDGQEYLDEALEKGKGVVLLHTHFGNPQILMLALGYSGYPVNQIAGSPVEDWEDLFQRQLTPIELKVAKLKLEYEKTLPVKFIYVSHSVRPAFECLKDNEVLAAAIDGGKDKNKVYVHFLNHTAFFSSGPLRVAYKTKAEILPLFVIREHRYRHRVVIEPPLEFNSTGNIDTDIKEMAQNFVLILEKYVRRYPYHYLQVIVSDHRWRFVYEEPKQGG